MAKIDKIIINKAVDEDKNEGSNSSCFKFKFQIDCYVFHGIAYDYGRRLVVSWARNIVLWDMQLDNPLKVGDVLPKEVFDEIADNMQHNLDIYDLEA